MPKIFGFLSFWLCWAFLCVAGAHATHNAAGDITYRKIGDNNYEITIITYTDPSSQIDRCYADLEIWDEAGENRLAIISNIPRMNSGAPPVRGGCSGEALNGQVIRAPYKINIYRTTYRFNGPGRFQLRYYDFARVDNVLNMSNSVNTAFYVQTVLNNVPFIGDNRSPFLLNIPLDDACTGKVWEHNPGGWDENGDSLHYSLICNRQYDPPQGLEAPVCVGNYRLPFGGDITINPQTGLITWDAPTIPGKFNIAILVEEFRGGRKIGELVRDMLIIVDECDNDPPVIEAITDTCAKPGETLIFDVRAYDPNRSVPDSLYFYLNNSINLEGELVPGNGPFAVENSPAEYVVISPGQDMDLPIGHWMGFDDLLGQVQWEVNCSHIRKHFYQADFYAHDNLNYDPMLSDHHATMIHVRPQAMTELNATPGSREITLEWTPHPCDNALGYRLYRSETGPDDASFEDGACCNGGGVPGNTDYELIAQLEGYDNNTFEDDNNGEGLPFRAEYCYRVVAVFQDPLSGELIESCPSEDTCLRILRDMPLITRDSIRTTDAGGGSLTVRWTPPNLEQISPDFFPPPYTYAVYEAPGVDGPAAYSLVADNIAFEDTSINQGGLNTLGEGYRYKIALFDANGERVVESDDASSIYLETIPAHEAIRLVWEEHVPWLNTKYAVYRSDNGPDGDFFFLDTLDARTYAVPAPGAPNSLHTYVDRGLTFGEEYCYFVRSFGTYLLPGLEDLVNDSNISCEVPADTVPPCLPGPDSIFVNGDCEEFFIDFSWIKADSFCAGDTEFYTVYYSRDPGGPYEQILRVDEPEDTDSVAYRYTAPNGSIAGCYRITATDSLEVDPNESGFSAEYCIDNCPVFVLPNVFTPNGDGINDVLKAQLLRSVDQFNFKVYDRWGRLLHTSSDPLSLWDGRDDSGGEAPESYYFYQLDIQLDNLNRTKLVRTGGITLLR